MVDKGVSFRVAVSMILLRICTFNKVTLNVVYKLWRKTDILMGLSS